VIAADLDLLQERIRALLDADADGVGLPRAEIEPTLTEGYARALELDAESLRIEKRIELLTREVAGGREVRPGRFSSLLRAMHESETKCAELRTLLESLRRLAARAA
jgi:hypothetical protein